MRKEGGKNEGRQAIYKMLNATDERRLTYQQSLTSRMLTVDNTKFNGRRPVFNFYTINSAFLQFSAKDFFNWDYS